MDIDSHKRLLSVLHICYGAFMLFVLLIIQVVLSFAFTAIPFEEVPIDLELLLGFVKGFVFVLVGFVPVMSIIGGIATLGRSSWGLVLLMVSGCFSILNFPFGTALGAYTIWIFIENNKQQDVKTDQ